MALVLRPIFFASALAFMAAFGLSILTPFLASTLASGTKPVGLVNISVKT